MWLAFLVCTLGFKFWLVQTNRISSYINVPLAYPMHNLQGFLLLARELTH